MSKLCSGHISEDGSEQITLEALLAHEHWVLIDGLVYDIEHYELHPGSQHLEASGVHLAQVASTYYSTTPPMPGTSSLRAGPITVTPHSNAVMISGRGIGIDCGVEFREIGHSPKARQQMRQFLIGEIGDLKCDETPAIGDEELKNVAQHEELLPEDTTAGAVL